MPVVVEVEHGVVGEPVTVEVGERVVEEAVAVEVQPDRVERRRHRSRSRFGSAVHIAAVPSPSPRQYSMPGRTQG